MPGVRGRLTKPSSLAVSAVQPSQYQTSIESTQQSELDAVREAMAVIEFSPDGIVITANNKVMSFLGKQKRSLGLGSSGLANLLISQKDEVAKAMPAGRETRPDFRHAR